jgi:hypothetical protein
MKLAKDTKQKIIRDGLVSLFIYALPIVLMFLYFSLTHQKPWLNQSKKQTPTNLHH